MHYIVLYPQNGDRFVTIDSVTSLHAMYIAGELYGGADGACGGQTWNWVIGSPGHWVAGSQTGASTPYKRWSKCTMKKIGGEGT